MEIPKPQKVQLTPEERSLLEQITFEPRRTELKDQYEEVVRRSCLAAAALAESVLERQAIPKIRFEYFTEPKYNIGSRKSREQIFEENRTTGRAILEHPHFLQYLKYFIFGPALPESTIEQFCQIVLDDMGTSGMLRDQLRSFARSETVALALIELQPWRSSTDSPSNAGLKKTSLGAYATQYARRDDNSGGVGHLTLSWRGTRDKLCAPQLCVMPC